LELFLFSEIVSVRLLLKPNSKNDTVGGQKALAADTDAGKDNTSIPGIRYANPRTICLREPFSYTWFHDDSGSGPQIALYEDAVAAVLQFAGRESHA
jgi:hypothetical protein